MTIVPVLEKTLGPAFAAAAFATTHWSVVLRAGDQHSPESSTALEKLCHAHWYPLYAFARRQRHREIFREEIAHTVRRPEEI